MKKIKNYFFSGILIVAPLGLSLYVAWVVVGLADKIFRPFIPLSQLGIPSEIPGVGLIVAFLFFTVLGAIAGSFFGKFYHKTVDGILSKIPGLNSIYSTVKQIIDTFESNNVSIEDGPFAMGEVSFHHNKSFHTAASNNTTQTRVVLANTFFADGARVVEQPTMISGDWQKFIPNVGPGEIAASKLNPICWPANIKEKG